MKQLKEIINIGIVIFAATSITTVAANTNGYVFPPANALNEITGNTQNGYVYPPQTPVRPRMNRMPQAPNYNYKQAYPQQPRLAPNYNNRAATYRRPPAYPQQYSQQYPQQKMQGVAPRVMPRTVPRTTQRMMPQAGSRQAYQGQKRYPSYPYYRRNNNSNNYNNSFPFSNNMMPFGNSGNSNFFPFSNNNMPFNSNSFGMPNNPMNNMFGNNKNGNMPFFNQSKKKRKKAWGTERNIWPDFYTDFTDEAWDTAMGGPRDLGAMPGGWRFPYISTPDPVTVSDAIANQFPPIAEEAGNMTDFSDWGVFDNK